jgi:AcrR family transcriptional regulator
VTAKAAMLIRKAPSCALLPAALPAKGAITKDATLQPRRRSALERRQQIIETTMELVARYGVQGTTTSRIAASVGVSEAALYRYFGSRTEILLAALDLVYERIFRVIHSADQENVLERLRGIARVHSRVLPSDTDGFVYPLFEFVAAAPEVGLREALADRQRKAIKAIADIIEEGKAQGTIAPEVDSEQAAWELTGVYWTRDISYLMGLTEYLDANRGEQMLTRILDSISAGRD